MKNERVPCIRCVGISSNQRKNEGVESKETREWKLLSELPLPYIFEITSYCGSSKRHKDELSRYAETDSSRILLY